MLSIGKKFSRLTIIISLGFIAQTTAQAQVYLSEDFESGHLNKWYLFNDSAGTTKTSIVKNIGGNPTSVVHLPFNMPAGGPQHRAFGQYIAADPRKSVGYSSIDHLFVSGRFYSAPTSEPTAGRKIIYIKSEPWTDPKFDLIVGLYGGVGGSPICLTINSNPYTYSSLGIAKHYSCGKVKYGKWHFIEVEIKLNTVNKKDGLVRLWLDGNLEFERTGISLRADNKPLGWIEIGRQIDREGDTLPRNEDRYWDDITFSSTYVGVGAKPTPPNNIK